MPGIGCGWPRTSRAGRPGRRAEPGGGDESPRGDLYDAGSPAALRALRDAPPVLYVRGAWSGENDPGIAFVGTRRASAYGLGFASAFGEILGAAGVVVVRGLARGGDGEVHAGALGAGDVTEGILGCGVDVVSPEGHGSLMEAIVRRGAVMAEVPLGTCPRPQQFPPRNRIISGLARAVVVVERDVDSGALITARYPAAQGRPVFAVWGSVCAPISRGPHRLLSRGARVVEDPQTLLAALHVPPRKASGREAGEPLEPAEARVLAVSEEQALHIDRVIERAGLSPCRVLDALAALEVRGLVRQFPGKNFARQPYGPGTERSPAGGVVWPNHSSS